MAARKSSKREPEKKPERARYPEAFVFEAEGDAIEGRVVRWSRAFSKYGPHPVCVVKDNAGKEWSIHCMATVLRSAMENEDPQFGEVIRVERGAKVENKEGTAEYTEYFVTVLSARKSGGSIHDINARIERQEASKPRRGREKPEPMERGSRDMEPGDDLPEMPF